MSSKKQLNTLIYKYFMQFPYRKLLTWSKDKYKLYDKCVIIANIRRFFFRHTNPAISSDFTEPILFSKFGLQYTFLCNTKELPQMIALMKYN